LSGRHVLVHAPTGSGKTLSAFLWAIDRLFARPEGQPRRGRASGNSNQPGVRVLYISPLRALNNDIERNLRAPLAGIEKAAADAGANLAAITVAVRTGDTPASARAAMLRRPPDILITTPESLFLVLTSPKARDILRTVRTVIVDEIHTVCSNKRGSHLALSLERLERLSPGFQRIGLSATQRPLDEVARFLGGADVADTASGLAVTPRPVSIVDSPYRRKMDLQVLGMPEQAAAESSGSVWPAVIPRLLDEIRSHKTTLVFANSRRQAERAADRLNTQWAAGQAVSASPGDGAAPPDPWALHAAMTGGGRVEGPFRAHHGSVSESVRRQLEKDLKAGRLPALIGTSSLELGIDIGSVDLVVQLQAPKSVTQGLQRIGRSGHGVGQTSTGRIYALTSEDLAESAAVARGMLDGDVEPVRAPRNALDVLAQHLVAIVASDEPPARHVRAITGDAAIPGPGAAHPGWPVQDLYRLVRGAYPYSDLSEASFQSVLKLIAGKYPRQLSSSLKPRVNWDEQAGLLRPLPPARLAAISQGGALVDRGVFSVYLSDGKTRLGELDEEFVWESRPGDAFMLGSQVWRATAIDDDRVTVEPAPGAVPRMPFWRGDFPWRHMGLSLRVAELKSELAARLAPHISEDDDPPAVMAWLQRTYALDRPGASQLLNHVRRQVRAMGAIATADTVVVETYQDPVGDRRIVVHSPFGGRVNAPWSIAIAAAVHERTGQKPEVQVGDDGVLLRVPDSDSPLGPGLIESMSVAEVRERVLSNLSGSALFGAVFRQNAARALLLPGKGRGKRTPFWLQRLKARDLLATVKSLPDFPVLIETYRDCLEDVMDIPALEDVVGRIASGKIKVVHVESRRPSPMAESLSFGFTAFYMYEWDAPKAERSLQALRLDRAALASLFRDPSFAGLLKAEAAAEVIGEVSRSAPGRRARSADDLAQLIEELGDLSEDEIADRCEGDAASWLAELEAGGRVGRVTPGGEQRWVTSQAAATYAAALKSGPVHSLSALADVLARWLAWSGPVTEADVRARYGLSGAAASDALTALASEGRVISGYFTPGAGAPEWLDLHALTAIQSRTLALARSEISPVSPERWQWTTLKLNGLAPEAGHSGKDGLREALHRLAGIYLEPDEWTDIVLPARVPGFSLAQLESLLRDGEFNCIASMSGSEPRISFIPRGAGELYLPDARLLPDRASPPPGDDAAALRQFLASEGVATSADMRVAFAAITPARLAAALRELLLASEATTDSWSAIQAAFASPAPAAAEPAPVVVRRFSADRRASRAARRTVASRLRLLALSLPPDARWWLTNRFAVMGPAMTPEKRAEARAIALLERHGVVSRRAVEAEDRSWQWRDIEAALALMELRGQARRGYFVRGLPGVQYARPVTVDALRGVPTADAMPVAFCATDPAAVAALAELPEGSPSTGRPARLRSTFLAQAGDSVILTAHRRGEEVIASTDPALRSRLVAAVDAMRARICGDSLSTGKMTVSVWNGQPVLKSEGAGVLAAAGFRRDYPSMSWDPVRGRPEIGEASPASTASHRPAREG
jgi:ATP-dependent Lhr-like helicase